MGRERAKNSGIQQGAVKRILKPGELAVWMDRRRPTPDIGLGPYQ